MKLGSNSFCYGSTLWTNGVPYNPSKFVQYHQPHSCTIANILPSPLCLTHVSNSLLSSTFASGYDAKSALFDLYQGASQLRFSSSNGAVTVSFAWGSTPRDLMTTNNVPFSPYPDYQAWRAVFTSVRTMM